MDWPVKAPFTMRVAVGPEDVDGFGHVNNLVYARWCLECAWAHSNALGFSMDDYKRLGRGMVVHRHEFDYVGQAEAGDAVVVATWVAENDGRLRMARGYEVRRDGGELLLRGVTRFVCVDMNSLKPARMPVSFGAGYPVAVPA